MLKFLSHSYTEKLTNATVVLLGREGAIDKSKGSSNPVLPNFLPLCK